MDNEVKRYFTWRRSADTSESSTASPVQASRSEYLSNAAGTINSTAVQFEKPSITALRKQTRHKLLLAAHLSILALLVDQALTLAPLLPFNWVLSILNTGRISIKSKTFPLQTDQRKPQEEDTAASLQLPSALRTSRECRRRTWRTLCWACRRRSRPRPLRPHCRRRPAHQVLWDTSSRGRAAEDNKRFIKHGIMTRNIRWKEGGWGGTQQQL